jgi:hypothetical protein
MKKLVLILSVFLGGLTFVSCGGSNGGGAGALNLPGEQGGGAGTTINQSLVTGVKNLVDNDPDLLKTALFNIINTMRTQEGIVLLEADADVADVAQAYADEMSQTGYYSHTDQYGNKVKSRLKDRIGDTQVYGAAENIASGSISDLPDDNAAAVAQFVFNGWMNSPDGHKDILQNRPPLQAQQINPPIKFSGIGVSYRTEANGTTTLIIVMNFMSYQ